ncbi:MAG: hypothetical protein ACKVP0_23845 [Pirellulaceae bacterium]
MSLVPFILVLLAANPQGVPAGHGAHAAEHAPAADTKGVAGSVVFECDFGTSADRNYDGWPDGWTRRHGMGYPQFLKIGIAEDKSDAARGSMLLMEMNGGLAEVTCPRIPITPSFSYVLEGECRLTDLVHDDAHVTLTFLSAKGKALHTHEVTISGKSAGREWQPFRLDPFTPTQDTAAASFTLRVAPRDKRQDLRGQVAFRRIRLQRLPRVILRASSPLAIFTSPDQVEVQCEIAGIPHTQTTLHFEIWDHDGHSLDTDTQNLTTGPDAIARAVWKPAVPGFGFYRVQVRWQGLKHEKIERETTLVVLRPASLPKVGQFGWTLPSGEDPLDSPQMAGLLAQSGIHWAKYPVTFSPADASAADRIAWFAEKLSLQGVEMIGVLDHPQNRGSDSIANILEDADSWQPWVDPIMTRLSLKIRRWQLGSDQDTSLVGYPKLAQKARDFKKHLERFGQEVELGAAWDFLSPALAADVPLSMRSYTAEPALTAAELETHLTRPVDSTQSTTGQRWVTLTPLTKESYSLATRAHDLAARMLAAQVTEAGAVFLSKPFDPETGVMNADGTPGELFLPWRTTAVAVTGSEYLGQMQLPCGSTNHVFAREGEGVMAVWNDQPIEETMYFGEELKQIDLWGHETTLLNEADADHPRHRIQVDRLPTFITGLNVTVARFKLAAQFETPQVESSFSREQTIYLRLKNFFPQGISGDVKLTAPAGWKVDTQGTRFRLAPGEELRLPITIMLLDEASTGPQPLRLDFSLSADRSYQFSVHRTLQLGLADVAIEMSSRLREDGLLEVTQQLTNFTGKSLSFRCVLFAPGRRRETRQFVAPPNLQSPLLFLLEEGESLIGQKITLRVEERVGGRVLNYSLTAER